MINEDNEEEDNLSTLKSVSVIEVGRSLQVASCPALRGRLASHLDTSNISYMIIIIIVIILIIIIVPIAPCGGRPSWPRRESPGQA